MSSSHATSGGRHRLCQVWLLSPCGCVQMPGLAEAGGTDGRSGGRPGVLSSVWDGTFLCPSCLWSSVHSPWVQQLLLPLLSHPWVCGRYSMVSQFLGPWNVCFRLLSICGFLSLSCCNLDHRTCDPIMASLSSSTPIADLASVQPHWVGLVFRTWATSWGSSRLQAASPLGGPCLSRNYS